jgi:hypothetical protein
MELPCKTKPNHFFVIASEHFRLGPQDEDFRMKLGGLVVVASNAGGAWTEVSCSVLQSHHCPCPS